MIFVTSEDFTGYFSAPSPIFLEKIDNIFIICYKYFENCLNLLSFRNAVHLTKIWPRIRFKMLNVRCYSRILDLEALVFRRMFTLFPTKKKICN